MNEATSTTDDRNVPANQSTSRGLEGCASYSLVVIVLGVVGFLLLPGGGESPRGTRRYKCRMNLKQIGLALHNYHDAYKSFPPAYVVDETGKPMHSWRVLILPYLDQQQLYDQYDFDEPWDGPNNRKLIEHAPEVLTCPSFPDDTGYSRDGEESLTQYFVVSGPHTIFAGSSPSEFRNIIDGTQNSLMVVECHKRRVAWTAPIDISRDELVQSRIVNDSLSSHPGGFQGALADGSVRFIADTIELETFRRLLTIDDGHPIPDY